MDCELINEHIDVVTTFAGGKFIPRLFVWRGRKYKVEKIGGRWTARCGEDKLFSFSVSADSGNVYELELNTHDMRWKLVKIYAG